MFRTSPTIPYEPESLTQVSFHARINTDIFVRNRVVKRDINTTWCWLFQTKRKSQKVSQSTDVYIFIALLSEAQNFRVYSETKFQFDFLYTFSLAVSNVSIFHTQ